MRVRVRLCTNACVSHRMRESWQLCYPVGTQEKDTAFGSCTTAKVGTPAVGIEWKPTREHVNADGLSRLPLPSGKPQCLS